jgi:hypothetical protein
VREFTAAIYMAADHGLSFGVIVFRDRQNQAAHVAAARRVEAVHALHNVPAEIAAFGEQVNLFVLVLSDVRHKQPACWQIEGEAPGVAQAIGIEISGSPPPLAKGLSAGMA